MKNLILKKSIASFFLVAVLVSQTFFGIQYLVRPTPAQALFGIGDITFSFNTEIASPYQVFKDIGTAAAKRIAKSYIDKYLGKFVDQLLDKYKIKNYLYYASMLDMYYLNQYIGDQIGDPDLRQVYLTLANNVKINIYTNSEVEKRKQKESLQQFQEIKTKYHEDNGGISSQQVLYPDPNMSDLEYFDMLGAYFSNPEEASEEALRGSFSKMVGSAREAADREIANSNGVKNERTRQEQVVNGVRTVQHIISNPSFFVQELARGGVDQLFANSADANNIWSTVGSLVGNFVFKKLDLLTAGSDSNSNVIQEYPTSPLDPNSPTLGETIDMDGDGFPEGEDVDGDGALESPEDVCFHGGVPGVDLGCTQSRNVSSSAFFTPLCQGLDQAIDALSRYSDFITVNEGHLNSGGGKFRDESYPNIWARRSQEVSSKIDDLIRAVSAYRNPNLDAIEIRVGKFSYFMNKITESLAKDGDIDINTGSGNGIGGINNLQRSVASQVNYLENLREALGKCEDPDTLAMSEVEPPDDIIFEPSCEVPATARGNDAGAPTTVPNINEVVFREAPQVAGWDQTGNLSSVTADEELITLSYDKANTWPSVLYGTDPSGQEVRAVANPWILVWRGGAWQATTFSWMKPGQFGKAVDEVSCGGPAGSPTLGDFKPVAGETYGFMVSMIARDAALSAQQAALNGGKQERTNILMYRWTTGGTGTPPGPGPGGVCSDNGAGNINYANSVQAGINYLNTNNPNGVADLMNTEAGGNTYLEALATYLQSAAGGGFRATANVVNGNNIPHRGELIAIWREGDVTVERYDAVRDSRSGNLQMRVAATGGNFTGDIPIICTY